MTMDKQRFEGGLKKATGAIKFNWKGTHSSLAHVEQTDKGLVA